MSDYYILIIFMNYQLMFICNSILLTNAINATIRAFLGAKIKTLTSTFLPKDIGFRL